MNDDARNLYGAAPAKVHGVRLTIALVHDPASAAVYERGGVDVAINPRQATAEEMVRFADDPRVKQIAMFEDDRFEVLDITVSPESKLANKRFKDLPTTDALIGAVIRDDAAFFPTAPRPGRGGSRDHVRRVEQRLGAARILSDPARGGSWRGPTGVEFLGMAAADDRVPARVLVSSRTARQQRHGSSRLSARGRRRDRVRSRCWSRAATGILDPRPRRSSSTSRCRSWRTPPRAHHRRGRREATCSSPSAMRSPRGSSTRSSSPRCPSACRTGSGGTCPAGSSGWACPPRSSSRRSGAGADATGTA